jgi:hypothetical protein
MPSTPSQDAGVGCITGGRFPYPECQCCDYRLCIVPMVKVYSRRVSNRVGDHDGLSKRRVSIWQRSYPFVGKGSHPPQFSCRVPKELGPKRSVTGSQLSAGHTRVGVGARTASTSATHWRPKNTPDPIFPSFSFPSQRPPNLHQYNGHLQQLSSSVLMTVSSDSGISGSGLVASVSLTIRHLSRQSSTSRPSCTPLFLARPM